MLISTPNRFSAEGIKGKMQELILKKRWAAWNTEHKHIFSSFEFLALLNKQFSAIEVWGYYFLPHLAPEKIERALRFSSQLRFSKSHHQPFNMVGFQTTALLKRIRMKQE